MVFLISLFVFLAAGFILGWLSYGKKDPDGNLLLLGFISIPAMMFIMTGCYHNGAISGWVCSHSATDASGTIIASTAVNVTVNLIVGYLVAQAGCFGIWARMGYLSEKAKKAEAKKQNRIIRISKRIAKDLDRELADYAEYLD